MRERTLAGLIFFLLLVIPQESSPFEGGYQNGLFVKSEDGLYLFKTNLQFQPHYQFLSIEGQGKAHGFQMRRLRIKFSGHAVVEELTYLIEYELVGGRTSNASEGIAFTGPNLRDAILDYKWKEWLGVRVGQFKVPYNREELTSSWQHQFVDLSLSNEVFTFERDLGLALYGALPEKKLEYTAYVANEGGNRNTANNNNEMLFGGRMVFNIAGEHGYTMSDVAESDELQLALGIASTFNRIGSPTVPDQDILANTGDVAFRYEGFSFLGEWHLMRNTTADTDTYGFLGQTGYFLIPKHLETVGRFAAVIPTAAGVTNGYESGIGLNYFFKGHRLKLQTDYSILWNSALVLGVGGAAGTNAPGNIVTTGGAPGFVQNQDDHRVRTQLQLYF